ncbi:MAG: hypothetical protein AB7N80_06715 [Bdellovibrionales bacterium]
MKSVESQSQTRLELSSELPKISPDSPLWNEKIVAESGKRMTWKGRTYVRIDQEWYEQRADNIYMVKGVKTYFVDNARVGVERMPTKIANAMKGADQKATEVLEKISHNPLRAYSPEQMGEVMDVVNEAKAKVEERDKALKELSRADQ